MERTLYPRDCESGTQQERDCCLAEADTFAFETLPSDAPLTLNARQNNEVGMSSKHRERAVL